MLSSTFPLKPTPQAYQNPGFHALAIMRQAEATISEMQMGDQGLMDLDPRQDSVILASDLIHQAKPGSLTRGPNQSFIKSEAGAVLTLKEKDFTKRWTYFEEDQSIRYELSTSWEEENGHHLGALVRESKVEDIGYSDRRNLEDLYKVAKRLTKDANEADNSEHDLDPRSGYYEGTLPEQEAIGPVKLKFSGERSLGTYESDPEGGLIYSDRLTFDIDLRSLEHGDSRLVAEREESHTSLQVSPSKDNFRVSWTLSPSEMSDLARETLPANWIPRKPSLPTEANNPTGATLV